MGPAMPLDEINRLITDPRRQVRLEGVLNFRDIGGYPTQDGRRVCWGRVYRSAHVSSSSARDQAQIQTLGIKAVVDLRSQEERDLEPSRWSRPPLNLYESGQQSIQELRREIGARCRSVEDSLAFMTAYYAMRPTRYASEYRAMFTMLAERQWPMLVHCTAGKDRTGTACALLLTALGVPRQIVIRDYALTSTLLPSPSAVRPAQPTQGIDEGMKVDPSIAIEVRATLWEANPAFISAALDSINRDFGSIQCYLRNCLNLNDDQICAVQTLAED